MLTPSCFSCFLAATLSLYVFTCMVLSFLCLKKYIDLCYLCASLFFLSCSPVTHAPLLRFINFEMESHHVMHLYLNRVTGFVVFTRRADRKLSQRTSPPIFSSTGNLLFYPYVVMCAFLFFFSLHFLVYMRFLFLHLSSAPAQRQLSYSAGPQCQLSTCSELSQAQHQSGFSSLAVGAQ